ncbi:MULTISPECIES: hypothetical protein [Streptosporangium]|uniref:DUF4307 domain-containing protein n=1 Tax=Streptosporangium brasiliense TaxID=47480 RepID=A0ABT9RJM6_9ACTN|nr:hypothetical protein [Streptosporangium brasiliense]MDP9869489.1 hypothetical protein [Streptosporangium brasiliense]
MSHPTPASFFKKPGFIVLLVALTVLAVLLTTVHINKPYSHFIGYVTPSPDGRTLTARLMFGEPKADGTFCEQVRGVEVNESTSQVAIDIQVFNTCSPLFSWGRVITTGIGYPFDVNMSLRTPLARRTVVDKESRQPVSIVQPSDNS